VVPWRTWQRPDWMDREACLRLSNALAIREDRVRVPRRGFRTCVQVLATLLATPQVHAEDLAELAQAHWQAELDQRSVKVTLGAGMLRCKIPEMVRKELWRTWWPTT
jgi:hypothetical protein